ncbi:uncharacterized protein MELLADRAFT_109864 [Melampsora larici-populina 98AG31]|uniref:Uncharacterized protein n=1 Tax=Melampsora larici-populina (strain 98AG31 / pathotype 3-4-7) TaxID=747676 RepID=F4RXW2_MELLP|nr:uncharacterized protein MELLADRAFT_109864 [Melampsora larici-populina 98AG31]EGG02798.1 hypothetical protein MELLADRAFT_109864 [Melampsora larici-populina 98AG31]
MASSVSIDHGQIQDTIISYRIGYLTACPIMGIILGVCFRKTYSFHTNQATARKSLTINSTTSPSEHSLTKTISRSPSDVSSMIDTVTISSLNSKEIKKIKFEIWRVRAVCSLTALAFLFLAIDNLSAIKSGRPSKRTPWIIEPAGYLIPAISGSVQLIVQTYFVKSLYGITKSRYLTIPIWTLSIISFIGSCGRTITIAISNTNSAVDGFKPSIQTQVLVAGISRVMYILWLGGAVLVDIGLAVGLSYNLKKSSYGGFRSTQSLVTKLADGFLMTFSCSALIVVLTAFIFFVPDVGTSSGKPLGIGSFSFMTFLHVPTYYLSFIYTLTRRKEIGKELRTEQTSCKLVTVP